MHDFALRKQVTVLGKSLISKIGRLIHAEVCDFIMQSIFSSVARLSVDKLHRPEESASYGWYTATSV
jgi:hypothetical protein